MAITDVPAFAHLTDADIENLAVELDAIRLDIEDSLGERDARYTPPHDRPRNVLWTSPAGSCWPVARNAQRGGRER